MQAQADASAAWLAANRPDLVNQPVTSAEQAEQIRQDYLNNRLPVLPVEAPNQYHYGQPMPGETYTVYDFSGMTADQRMNQTAPSREVSYQEYVSIMGRTPDQSEQLKHDVAFHPETVNPSNLPADMREAYYGEMTARTHEYYRQNPSPAYLVITGEYYARRGGAPAELSNPFAPDSAAGIDYLVGRQGGSVTESLKGKAIIEADASYGMGAGAQIFGNLNAVSGRSTVPTRDLSSGMPSGPVLEAGFLGDPLVDVYMPYGEYAQVKVADAKILMGYNTGELGVYQKPFGHSIYNLSGGGSRNALQSGMFTIEKPETPYVVDQWDVGTYTRPSGEGKSRLGAEAYGGYVRPLDDRRLEPNDAFSRYGGTYNLANYVNPEGPNLGKAAAPGANIPWSVDVGAPAIQYMDTGGIVPGSAVAIPGSGRPSGDIAMEPVAAGLPAPFRSPSAPAVPAAPAAQAGTATEVIRPSDFDLWAMGAFGGGAVAAGLITVSDFWLGGRTKERTEIGPERRGQAVTEVGVPVTTVKEIPGGYEYTTTTPYTTKQDTTRDIKTTIIPMEGGFTGMLNAFEGGIRQRIPSPEVGEQAVKVASLANPFIGPQTVGSEIVAKGTEIFFGKGSSPAAAARTNADIMYTLNPASLENQYEYFHEHPTEAALSLALGVGLGAGAGILERGYMAGRGAVAEKVISQGGKWRALEQVGATVAGRAPQVLGGLYAVDIGSRSTGGFTEVTPGSMSKGKAIVMQEAVPMGIGFSIPGQVVKGVRTAEMDYRQFQQEYAESRPKAFIKQEATVRDFLSMKADQNLPHPVRAIQNDYAAFVQEGAAEMPLATIKRQPNAVDYLRYKLGTEVTPAPEPTTLQFPEVFIGDQPVTYEPINIARTAYPEARGSSMWDAAPKYAETNRNYYDYIGIEGKAYPQAKPKTAQDVLIDVYSKYYNTRGKVADFISGKSDRAIEPEIDRGFTDVWRWSQEITPHPDADIPGSLYTKTVGHVLPRSTFGETAPLYGFTATQPGPVRGGGATRGTPPSGQPPARFRKTMAGGRERMGLAKEPSLASMGIKESIKGAGEKGRPMGQRMDFRGKPVSEKMKPMDKSSLGYRGARAAGSQELIMTEKLPVVEGMTKGKVSPQQLPKVWGFPGVSLVAVPAIETVEVIEPRTEFSQESEYRRTLGQWALQDTGTRQVQAEIQKVDQTPSLIQRSQRRQFTEQARQSRSDMQMRVPSSSQNINQRIKTGQDTRIVPMSGTSQRTGQETRTRQRQDQSQRQDQTTDIIPRQIIIPVTGGGGGGGTWKLPGGGPLGGGGGGGGYLKGHRAYVETLGFEMSRFRKGAFTIKKIKRKK